MTEGPAEMATEREQSLLFAAETAEALRRGWRPPDLNVPIARREDEMAFAAVPVTVEQFTGADVPYSQGVFLAAGGWGTLAASAIGSAIWNASERRAAERAAAPQWRPVDAGELYVTSWRLAARLRGSFMEVAYWDVQSRGSRSPRPRPVGGRLADHSTVRGSSRMARGGVQLAGARCRSRAPAH